MAIDFQLIKRKLVALGLRDPDMIESSGFIAFDRRPQRGDLIKILMDEVYCSGEIMTAVYLGDEPQLPPDSGNTHYLFIDENVKKFWEIYNRSDPRVYSTVTDILRSIDETQ